MFPAGLIFKVLFEISYMYQISPSFSYMGLVLSFNYQKLIKFVSNNPGIVAFGSWRARTPSAIILTVGLFMGVIPIYFDLCSAG